MIGGIGPFCRVLALSLGVFCFVLPLPAAGQSPELDLDVLAQDIKARPAGEIDGLLGAQIELVKTRKSAFRRTTEQLELQQRRCGSMPTEACRSGYDFLRSRRDGLASRLRMEQLKLDALVADRLSALKRQDGPGIAGGAPKVPK